MTKLFPLTLCCFLAACSEEPLPVIPEPLSAREFIHLERKMLTDDEQEFDVVWNEMQSRLYFTLQSRGVEYYSLKDRYQMASSLNFHINLNCDYVTQKHGTSIQGVASLLEWADMWDDLSESPPGTIKEWHDSILNAPSNPQKNIVEQDAAPNH